MNMIYLLRHGEIEEPANRRYIGQTDCALSKKGRAQADFWKKQLKGKGIAAIFCSDLIRSSDTAKVISNGGQVEILTDPDLREINLGDWDGRFMHAVRTEFPAQWAERGAHIETFRPPNGESFADLYQRVVPVFEQIVEKSAGPVVIVGHAGVNRMVLCHALGMPIGNLFSIRQDYGALNLIDNSRHDLRVAAVNICPEKFGMQQPSGKRQLCLNDK
jgi:alpha-ribazole phosphatase